MNYDFLEDCALQFIDTRLQKKLPLKTKDGEKYIRDRFYWIVDKFKEQYFVGGEKLETNAVLDRMFSTMKKGIDTLDLGKIVDFKVGLACSLVVAANKFGCSIKVTTDFFQDQFLRVIDQRFHRQNEFITKHVDFLHEVLTKKGVEPTQALKIIEAGIAFAEINPKYIYGLIEYWAKAIGGIVKECQRIKLDLTHEMLISDELKSMLKIKS